MYIFDMNIEDGNSSVYFLWLLWCEVDYLGADGSRVNRSLAYSSRLWFAWV